MRVVQEIEMVLGNTDDKEHSEQTRRWQCGTLLRQGVQDDVEGYQKMLLCLSRCDVSW